MSPSLGGRVHEIFTVAARLPESERSAYVAQACAGDEKLASEVLQKLKELETLDASDSRSTTPATALKPDDLVANRYRVIRLVGRGGMGEVYEVHDGILNESVAMKTILQEIAFRPSYIRRFKREIQLARKVTHPNVCRVYDVGESGSLHYFTMEFLRGETLSSRIRKQKRIDRAEAFSIARQMAQGLAAAHEMGIVHTDFKSGNVMLCPAQAGERAVITDFGLARYDPTSVRASQVDTVSAAHQMAGTLGYMSPEQLTGGSVTTASDIYSFGIVLYEMATGSIPFESRGNPLRAAVERMTVKESSGRTKVPGLHPRWDAAIARCLQPDAERRFTSAAALAEWFAETPWQSPTRFWTRREWALTAAAGSAVIGGSTVAWLAVTRPYQPMPNALDWYDKGVEALHSMTFDAARKSLEKAVEADPQFALAHASLALAFDELDYTDRAREEIIRAVMLARDTRLAKRDQERIWATQFAIAKDYERAAPLLRQLEGQADDRHKAAAALESGWLEQKRDNTDAAAEAYQRAIRLDPQYAAAKLRMGFILQRRGGRDEEALRAFTEAEHLYNAASDLEGVIESLYQRANLLNRRSRPGEALPLIEQAERMAEAMGNRYQSIRLQLLRGVVLRVQGDNASAIDVGRKAVDAAVAEGMDNLATSGLNALGVAYVTRGEYSSAEPLFQRMLVVAKRGRIRRFEALAHLSLGSLCEQDSRPKEAKEHVEAALPFHRQGGYRREVVQDTVVLGGALDQLAEYQQGIASLRDVLPVAERLRDARLEAQVRERLGSNLRHQGDWPKALIEFERAARLHGSTLRSGYARVDSAAVYWRLGRRADADRLTAETEALLKTKADSQLSAMLFAQRAEMALAEGRLEEALGFVRSGRRQKEKSLDDDRSLRLVEAAATIRARRKPASGSLVESLIAEMERSGLIGSTASARLTAAESWLVAGQKSLALQYAREACPFFETRKVWESVFRCELIAAKSTVGPQDQTHQAAARQALDQLKALWPYQDVSTYLARFDIAQLAESIQI